MFHIFSLSFVIHLYQAFSLSNTFNTILLFLVIFCYLQPYLPDFFYREKICRANVGLTLCKPLILLKCIGMYFIIYIYLAFTFTFTFSFSSVFSSIMLLLI
jgi:hypothetical protein